jgi:hypothetical protein
MIERPDPDALLAGPLGQWLHEQNHGREEVKARAAKIRNWGIVAACAVAVTIILFSEGNIGAALQFGFFTGMAGLGIAELIKRPMLNRLKGGINGAIAKALGLEYSLEVTPGKTFEWVQQFEMVPSHDSSRFQDLWWGVIGEQPFTLHEATLTEQRGSGKNRRTVTVFEGSIISIGFNRRFASTTLIEPHGERRKFLIGEEKEQVTIGELPLERVDVVHPGFEDRFTVWSNDQVEARYLVHPEYVERLLAVEAAFSGDDIRALFHEGDLLIALKTGDLFESGSLESGQDRMLLEKTIAQFGALADLAIALNERARMTMHDLGGSN